MAETDYRDSRTETFLREATIRKLRELSRHPVEFLDGSYSFDTIADQDNYGAGHAAFPVDVYSWSGEPYIVGTASPLSVKQFITGPVDIGLIRQASAVSSLTALDPWAFAWFNRYFWLAPRPTGVFTIAGDYRRDGRRDSTTGDLITVDSTTHTNGWFDEGENLLRCAVMLEWHESIAKDPTSIALFRDQVRAQTAIVKEARKAKRSGLMQAGDSMFGGGGSVRDKRAWRYQ